MSGASPLLSLNELSKSFGGLRAVDDLTISFASGETHCIIGPNGAGKSTVFKMILGLIRPSAGRVSFRGKEVTALLPHERINLGISVKMQVPGIFGELTARHNLQIAAQRHGSASVVESEVDRLLSFVRLTAQGEERAGNLAHGQQQWLEIAMALATRPALLLLDEPTAGMSVEETIQTGDLIKQLARSGVTVIAIEHDMAFVRYVADRVTVLHLGRVFAQGVIDEVVNDERVAAIYLGKRDAN
jgi:branched-chain amino acid transport system ATP-binding protein